MEEFLGVLFCGGRGTRIPGITKYTSKSFIPVYDKPVFKFGLELLEKSESINEIILLTNDENNLKLSQLGYKTIIQDDNKVVDMLTGWEFIKEVTGTSKNGVLVPSDNICEINIDKLISRFIKSKTDFLFSIHKINDKNKLSEMGNYDKSKRKFYYKNPSPKSSYGVIAPYLIKNNLEYKSADNIFEIENSISVLHKGYWFDLGDYESIAKANKWYRKKNKDGL